MQVSLNLINIYDRMSNPRAKKDWGDHVKVRKKALMDSPFFVLYIQIGNY